MVSDWVKLIWKWSQIAFEVDAKIHFGKKCKILQVFLSN